MGEEVEALKDHADAFAQMAQLAFVENELFSFAGRYRLAYRFPLEVDSAAIGEL